MRSAAVATSVGLHGGLVALTLISWPFMQKDIKITPEPVAVELISTISAPPPPKAAPVPDTMAVLNALPKASSIQANLPDLVQPKPVPKPKPKPKPEPPKPKPKPDPTPPTPKPEPKPAPKPAPPPEPVQPPKPTPVQKPAAPAADTPWTGLDLDKIAAAVDKTKAENPTPSTPPSSAVSSSDIDALKAKIHQCWSPDCGAANAGDYQVDLRINLNRDGSLKRPPQVTRSRVSATGQAAAEQAVRAVERCAPYSLPVSSYSSWKDITLHFDPKEVCQ